MFFTVILLLLGIGLLYYGADFLVRGSSLIAKYLKISAIIIGLTVVSFATSAPELFVSITAQLRGSADIAVGNVVGSNIANIGLVLGLSALIAPIPISSFTLSYILPFMLLTTIFCVIFIRSGWVIRMFEGLIFILLYLGFVLWTLSKVSL